MRWRLVLGCKHVLQFYTPSTHHLQGYKAIPMKVKGYFYLYQCLPAILCAISPILKCPPSQYYPWIASLLTCWLHGQVFSMWMERTCLGASANWCPVFSITAGPLYHSSFEQSHLAWFPSLFLCCLNMLSRTSISCFKLRNCCICCVDVSITGWLSTYSNLQYLHSLWGACQMAWCLSSVKAMEYLKRICSSVWHTGGK